jgi:hypothetical protein
MQVAEKLDWKGLMLRTQRQFVEIPCTVVPCCANCYVYFVIREVSEVQGKVDVTLS